MNDKRCEVEQTFSSDNNGNPLGILGKYLLNSSVRQIMVTFDEKGGVASLKRY